MRLITLAILALTACHPSGAESPASGSAVEYAIAHSVFLEEHGCSATEVAVGVVLTARHCLDDGAAVGEPFDVHGGIVSYISPKYDFAVVQYRRFGTGMNPITMRAPRIGEHVYVVGWPVQLGTRRQALTVTDGIVAGPDDGERQLRITAPVYFGNSGGGVWGDDGALLGVAVSIYAADQLFGPPMPYPAQSFMVPVQFAVNHLD